MKNYKAPVLLKGMGGMGKSTLMSNWVHQVHDGTIKDIKYKNIIYIDCSNDIKTGFLRDIALLEQLEAEYVLDTNSSENLKNIITKLEKLDNLLLVMDNLPTHQSAINSCCETLGELSHLPCHIIANSRSEVYDTFEHINISSLSEEKCIELFLKHSKVSKAATDTVKKIVSLGGRHTLIIELLGKIAFSDDYTPSELLDILHNNQFNISGEVQYYKNADSECESINSALEKLFNIAKLSKQQKHIIYHLSLMDGQIFTFDLIVRWLNEKDRRTLKSLVTSGWLQTVSSISDKNNESEIINKYYQLHSVINHTVRAAFCKNYDLDDRHSFFQPTILRLEQHYKDLDTYKSSPQTFSQTQPPQNQKITQACLPAVAAYLLNVVRLTNKTELLENSVSKLNWFAIFCQQQGLYTLSLTTLSSCIDFLDIRLGKHHILYATSISNLASAYQIMGDNERAITLYKQAFIIIKEHCDESVHIYADCLNNIASCYKTIGEYEKALCFYQYSLNIRIKYKSKNSMDYANSLNNMAGLHEYMGNYEEAILLIEEAMCITKNIYSEQHPYYANCLSILGNSCTKIGEYEKAYTSYDKALSIRRKTLGSKHSDYASSLRNLAILYSYMGNYKKSLSYYEQSTTKFRESLGCNHPQTLTCIEEYNYLRNNLKFLLNQ